VTFAREKRLLLGATALVVAIPLPFTDTLEWPVVALFLAVVTLFLRRAWQGAERWLSHRALNLLGLAYLPVLVIDAGISGRVQFVRPILHLILFGLAAKLWSLSEERDKWQVWIGLFFVFLASMSTSTHPSVVIYLLVFLGLAVTLLLRFVHLHVAANLGGAGAAPRPIGGFLVATVAATILLAAPLFALLPRIRTPVLTGPGAIGAQDVLPLAGFSDEMTLDRIGRIRNNPEVALRLRFEGRAPNPASLRIKGATYERFADTRWNLAPVVGELRAPRGSDTVQLVSGPAVGRATVELEPLQIRSLLLPVESLSLAIDARRLALDAGGAVRLLVPPTRPVEYSVDLAARPVSGAVGEPFVPGAGPLDPHGISPRIAALAAQWAGSGSDAQRAGRIESRLLNDYAYSLVLLGRGGESPVETFLFDTRQGHCEYFASSMVLLLRAQGIPARLITGFYGSEWSAWERNYVVRQSNAHAWVEGWIEDEGWQVFDPTPPDGRPAASDRSLALFARQAWEAIIFRWDRWVLSYDFDDQVSLFGELRDAWDRLAARLWKRLRERAAPAGADAPAVAAPTATSAPEEEPSRRGLVAVAVGVGIGAAIAAAWILRRRRAWTAADGYLGLRRALSGAGWSVPESLPPLELARRAGRWLPDARDPARRLVQVYVREAYAGVAPSTSELAPLRVDLGTVEKAVRRSRRRAPGS